MIRLLVISVVAMLATEANAATCTKKTTCSCQTIVGGSCYSCCTTTQTNCTKTSSCNWVPKGLGCTLAGRVTGPGEKELTCEGEGVCPGVSTVDGACVEDPTNPLEIPRDTVSGVVSCLNNGGHFALGANPGEFDNAQVGQSTFTADEFDKNGKFKKNVVAKPQNLSSLDEFCGPSGGGQTWEAFDVGFCGPKSFEVDSSILIESGLVIDGQIRAVCTGDCDTLIFDDQTGTFAGPPYQCFECPIVNAPVTGTPYWNCADCQQAGLGGPTNCKLL